MEKPINPHEKCSFAGMEELAELALDLRWSWDHGADDIWRPLAPELWDLTRNPWVILQTVAPGKLKDLARGCRVPHPGGNPGPEDARFPKRSPPGFKKRRPRRR